MGGVPEWSDDVRGRRILDGEGRRDKRGPSREDDDEGEA